MVIVIMNDKTYDYRDFVFVCNWNYLTANVTIPLLIYFILLSMSIK